MTDLASIGQAWSIDRGYICSRAAIHPFYIRLVPGVARCSCVLTLSIHIKVVGRPPIAKDVQPRRALNVSGYRGAIVILVWFACIRFVIMVGSRWLAGRGSTTAFATTLDSVHLRQHPTACPTCRRVYTDQLHVYLTTTNRWQSHSHSRSRVSGDLTPFVNQNTRPEYRFLISFFL